MNNKTITVVVLGASAKHNRYSNMAVKSLLEHNYNVIPVNPAEIEIHEIKSVTSLDKITVNVDLLTMYVNPKRSEGLTEEILSLNPKKIIFNPGTENPTLEKKCATKKIETERACTLILLNTGIL
ncbi:MAG: CoA-binding protein [Verrucomicrobiota bacterium]|nr:CoA-binding protein [Verrucomicrobiota bacterium]